MAKTPAKTPKRVTKPKRAKAFKLSADGAGTEENVHKYEATRGTTEVPAFEDLGALPASYGSPALFLIARDPQWLFCYWDLDAASQRGREIFLKTFADGREESTIAIHLEAKNWYLPVSKPGATYHAELGTQEGGEWQMLVRSAPTVAPPDGASQSAEATFATVPIHLTFQRLLEIVRSAMHKGETLVEALARLQSDSRGGGTTQWTDAQRELLGSVLPGELAGRLGLDAKEQASPIGGLFSTAFGALSETARGSEVSSWLGDVGSSWSAQPRAGLH